MPAIITNRFKKELLLMLTSDLADSASNYYVGISRSFEWDSADEAPTPTNTERTIRNAELSLISVKNVEAYSFVVPRYDWVSGSLYTGFNDNTAGHPSNSYYVITDENQVYICLEQGKNASGVAVTSTVKPTGAATDPFETADGYRWKFLYSIGALKSANFLSANFMPVELVTNVDSDAAADIVEQNGIQNAAVPGEVLGYTVVSGGSGYTSAPTLTVEGDGSGAKAVATVSGGQVVKVNVVDSDGFAHGTGYSYASVVASGGGGTGVNIRPIIGPAAGIGADPRDELRATAIMLTARPAGDEGGNWVIGNDFRQVALIKNPKVPGTDSDFTAATGNATKYMQLNTLTSTFSADKHILGATSQAEAYVVSVDSDLVYYVQDETTGFVAFEDGEAVSETDGSGSGTIGTALNYGDIKYSGGEVIYIDNRAAVTRSADQTEDVKIIIQL